MAQPTSIDQIAERVERLLVRYEELQRTNTLLAEQVELLTTERDSLKSRLGAARARVEALLERLPEAVGSAPASAAASVSKAALASATVAAVPPASKAPVPAVARKRAA